MGLLKGFVDNQKIKKFKEAEAKVNAVGMLDVAGSNYYVDGIMALISNRTMNPSKWNEIPCKLEPDPKNEHDPNAVKVMAKDAAGAWQLIGFVPAEFAVTVKSVLAAGAYCYLIAKPDSHEATGFTFKVKLFI